MIGQAAIGNPRIFTPHHPSYAEKLDVILRHLSYHCFPEQLLVEGWKWRKALSAAEAKEQVAHRLVSFRKFLFAYVKGIPASREWKNSLLALQEYDALEAEIRAFFSKTQALS